MFDEPKTWVDAQFRKYDAAILEKNLVEAQRIIDELYTAAYEHRQFAAKSLNEVRTQFEQTGGEYFKTEIATFEERLKKTDMVLELLLKVNPLYSTSQPGAAPNTSDKPEE